MLGAAAHSSLPRLDRLIISTIMSGGESLPDRALLWSPMILNPPMLEHAPQSILTIDAPISVRGFSWYDCRSTHGTGGLA